MYHPFAWARIGTAAVFVLAVVAATANVGVAQDAAAGSESSANAKMIPQGIVVLESDSKRLIGVVVVSGNRSLVAVSTKELLNRFGDVEELKFTDDLALHFAKKVYDDELRSISFLQVEKPLPPGDLQSREGALAKGNKLECLATAAGQSLEKKVVTVTHPRTTLDSKPVDYFRVEATSDGASCVLLRHGVVVGLGVSEVRSDPSDEKSVGIEVLPAKELLLAAEAYRQIESTRPFKLLYQKLYPKLTLEVHGFQDAVLLRGVVESDETRKQLREIAEQFFPKVLNQLHVQPVASPGKNSSEWDVLQFVQIGDDRGGIRATLAKLFPKAKLEVNFANEAVIIRGRVARSADISSIEDVAEQYFPRVLNFIVADDRPSSAAGQSARPFGSTAATPTVNVLPRDDQDAAMDRETKQLALRIRAADEPEKSKLRAELEKLTEQHFEHRQRRRDAEISELADRVDKLRVAQHRRQENKPDIIKRRVAELLDPDKKLEWDEANARSTAPTTTARRDDANTNAASPPENSVLPMPSIPKTETEPTIAAKPDAKSNAVTAALIRAAEARLELARRVVQHAEQVLQRVRDANTKVRGAVPEIEVKTVEQEFARRKIELEIAEAELDAAKAGVDISRPNKLKTLGARSQVASDSEEINNTLWTRLGFKLAKMEADEKLPVVNGTSYRGGLRVIELREKSPAATGGIRQGDILVGLDVWETVSFDNIRYILEHADVPSLKVVFLRGSSGKAFGFVPWTHQETIHGELPVDGVPARLRP